MNEVMFEELLESIQQAGAIRRGEIQPARKFEYQDIDIKAIRKKTGLSQAQFARLINVPLGTYQNWEQGRRRPQGAAMALLQTLLQIFDFDPQYALKALRGQVR